MGKHTGSNQLYRVVKKSIREAGRFLSRNFYSNHHLQVDTKQKNDFVTEIDRHSEQILIRAIKKSFPHHKIMAEESGMVNGDGEDYIWVIDPLDGTTNFIHRIPHFGISVSLLVRGEIEFSMILNPITHELFHAVKDGGSYLNGKKIAVSAKKELADSFGATGFPFKTADHLQRYTGIFKQLFSQSKGMRRCGAAVLDLAYLACGRYDYFWETYLEPWDFSGGTLLILEAGGLISDFNQKPLALAPSSVIGANPFIYPLILKEVSVFKK